VVSTREKLQGIRFGTTHPAQIDDVKIYTTVNRNEHGEISEIYMTTDREGTIITGLLNSLSKSISVMLQYHVPASDIASDLISKIIDIELGDFSRCQVKPDNYEGITSRARTLIAENEISSSIEDPSSITGERIYSEVCSHCSSTRLVKNGTCKVCQDCGTTTGCS